MAGWYVLEMCGTSLLCREGGDWSRRVGVFSSSRTSLLVGGAIERGWDGLREGRTELKTAGCYVLPPWWCGRHCLLAELQMNGEGEEREMRGSEGRN